LNPICPEALLLYGPARDSAFSSLTSILWVGIQLTIIFLGIEFSYYLLKSGTTTSLEEHLTLPGT